MTKSSAAITWIAVPFSSNLTRYSLLLTLIVTLPPILFITFTTTVALEPTKTSSATTTISTAGLLSSTVFSLEYLTAASPLYKLAIK